MKTVIGIIMVLLLTVGGLIGCQQSSPVRPLPPIPTPPSAPSNLTADAVSPSQVRLHWFDNSNNEGGFKLYRDNKVIATLPANTTAYKDTGLEVATTYQYAVKAYSQAGESEASLCSVRTPNPPITVRLDRIGVYFDHDPTFFMGAGDIYLYIGVADGEGQPQTYRIPSTGVIKLNDNETTEIGQQIFSTDCVGDELKVVVVAFESDALHGVVLGVIKVALGAYLGGGSGTAVSLITTLLGSQPSTEEGCPEGVVAETPEDDFVGAIERIWTSAENWGIGSYKDVQSGDLRLWFTIENPMEPLAPTETLTPTPTPTPSVTPQQFHLVTKDGIQIARPEGWESHSNPELVYSISKTDTIVIAVMVKPAGSQESLDVAVAAGDLVRTTVGGYVAYKNEAISTYHNRDIKKKQLVIMGGGKACLIYFVCDVDKLGVYEPIFAYVLDSFKFLSPTTGR